MNGWKIFGECLLANGFSTRLIGLRGTRVARAGKALGYTRNSQLPSAAFPLIKFLLGPRLLGQFRHLDPAMSQSRGGGYCLQPYKAVTQLRCCT
jgi:hypothetical protein